MEEGNKVVIKWVQKHLFHHVEFGVLPYWMIAGTLGALAAFALMQLIPGAARRRFIVGSTFVAGLFYSCEFFLPAKHNVLTPFQIPLGDAQSVVGAFTIGLGLLNLVSVHGHRVMGARKGWENSLAFFIALIAMIAFAFWNRAEEEKNPVARVGYRLLFEGGLQPLQATMFSVLAFYITSASYRAFRISSGEAALMTVTAFIVMLGQVPVGMWLTKWLPVEGAPSVFRFENLSNWLLTTINTSAVRAINFGVAIGGLAMALRIWLSLERGAYFDRKI